MCIKKPAGKVVRTRPYRRPRVVKFKDNISIDIKETGWDLGLDSSDT